MQHTTPTTTSPLYYGSLIFTSAISLWLSWYLHPVFLLPGFAPILAIEAQLSTTKKSTILFWLYCLGLMLFWNISTLWWSIASWTDGTAIVLKAALMTLPWVCYRITRQALGNNYGYLTFVLYWLSFEYAQLQGYAGDVWLVLGNAFAATPQWVQWYEYTGVLGGSLWMLSGNVLVYFMFQSKLWHNKRLYGFYTLFLVLCPLATSFIISYNYPTKPHVAFGQTSGKPTKSLQELLSQAEVSLDTNTRLLLVSQLITAPLCNTANITTCKVFQEAEPFLAKHPQLSIVVATPDAVVYLQHLQAPAAYTQHPTTPYWSVLPKKILHNTQTVALYNNTKAGTIGTMALPYSKTTNQYVKKGANLFFMTVPPNLANIYVKYARLRAIETRRDVVFCNALGQTRTINQLGQQTLAPVPNTHITVYAQQGNYIGRLAAFLAIGLLLTLFVKQITGGKTGILTKES